MATREFKFVDATRRDSKLRVVLTGPSGGGKTWTALEIMTALAAVTGDKIGMIDTERGSAGLYSPPFKFTHCKFDPPYDPQDLTRCLAQAANDNIGMLGIDTMSRFWSGQGGMLEQVDRVGKRTGSGGNFGGGWKEMRPVENETWEAILAYPGHIFATMRVKTAYEVGSNDRGQMVPRKIGLKPEQREGMEYEFGIVGDMDLDQNLTISKSRCPELTGKVFRKPGADVAAILLAWLETFAPGKTANDYRAAALELGVTFDQVRQLYMEAKTDQLLGAAILDQNGQLTNLGDFLVARGKEVTPIAAVAGAAPIPGNTAAPAPEAAPVAPAVAPANVAPVPDLPAAEKPADPGTAQGWADLAHKACSVDELAAIRVRIPPKFAGHTVTAPGTDKKGTLRGYLDFLADVLVKAAVESAGAGAKAA